MPQRTHSLEFEPVERYNPRPWKKSKYDHIPFCRCGWTGHKVSTKSGASRQYKLHRSYPRLSMKSMSDAAKDALKTFVAGHAIDLRINTTDWRYALGVYAKTLKRTPSAFKRLYTISDDSRGKGDLVWDIHVTFPGYDSSQLGKWTFDHWVKEHKGVDDMGTDFRFTPLNSPTQLFKASRLLLHIEARAKTIKQDFAKWAKWAVEYRTERLVNVKAISRKATAAANKKSTWQYLKAKYPTKEAALAALTLKRYSKSYTYLLNRLVIYWGKRE